VEELRCREPPDISVPRIRTMPPVSLGHDWFRCSRGAPPERRKPCGTATPRQQSTSHYSDSVQEATPHGPMPHLFFLILFLFLKRDSRNTYVYRMYEIFPRIKVGRPPDLALGGAPPLPECVHTSLQTRCSGDGVDQGCYKVRTQVLGHRVASEYLKCKL
jgi:hypothetical protein